MKQKYITPDNYKEFKPSEFVRSFVSDIDVAMAGAEISVAGFSTVTL